MKIKIVRLFIYLCLFFDSINTNAQNTISTLSPPITLDTYSKINFKFYDDLYHKDIAQFSQKYLSQLYAHGYTFSISDILKSPIGDHLNLQMTFNSLPIYQNSVKVNIKDKIAFSMLNSCKYYPLPEELYFDVNEVDAIQAGVEFTKGKLFFCKKILFPLGQKLTPAYHVVTYYDKLHGASDIIISARNKSILGHAARSSNLCSDKPTGKIFLPDPLASGEQTYKVNTLYCDNLDSNNAYFDSQYKSVDLNDLNKTDIGFELKGPYVVLADLDLPKNTPPVSQTGIFNFNRSEDGFEDVNIYYYIDNFQRYVQSLGFNNLFNFPIKADSKGLLNDDSKFFSAGVNSYLLFGIGGVDDAEDSDVIIHEYGHALSAWGSPNSMVGYERLALDEGICDYFAASHSRSITEYRWEDIYTWDGHNEFWRGRTVDSKALYPDLQKMSPTIHTMGQVWSTALMRAWLEIGRSHLDKLQLNELYMNNSRMSIKDAAYNILDIDSIVYLKKYRKILVNSFCESQIFDSLECKKLTTLDTPPSVNQLLVLQVEQSKIVRKLKHPINNYLSLKIFDIAGKEVYLSRINNYQTIYQIDQFPNGVYILQLEDKNGIIEHYKILLNK